VPTYFLQAILQRGCRYRVVTKAHVSPAKRSKRLKGDRRDARWHVMRRYYAHKRYTSATGLGDCRHTSAERHASQQTLSPSRLFRVQEISSVHRRSNEAVRGMRRRKQQKQQSKSVEAMREEEALKPPRPVRASSASREQAALQEAGWKRAGLREGRCRPGNHAAAARPAFSHAVRPENRQGCLPPPRPARLQRAI